MAAPINVFDESILAKTIDFLEKEDFIDEQDNNKIIYIMRQFPFGQLVEIEGLNHSVINLTSRILINFLRCDYFLFNPVSLQHTISFVNSNLNFMLKQTGCEDTLFQLFDVLRKLLQLLNTTDQITVNVDDILSRISSGMQSSYANIDRVKQTLYCIFVEVMNMNNIQFSNASLYLKCVNDLLTYEGSDALLAFQTINAIFVASTKYQIPETETIYIFIEMSIGQMDELQDDATTLNIMKAIATVISRCKCQKILGNITQELMKKLDVIFRHLRLKGHAQNYVMQILEHVIQFEFANTPWENEDLRKQINNLAQNQNWDPLCCELVFVIHYMEFMHLKVRHDKEVLVVTLQKGFGRNFPTNPCVIKAMYLLYSAYAVEVDTPENRRLGTSLLKYLENYQELKDVLTYHISQLIWALARGSMVLKLKVLKLWIKHHKNDRDLLVCTKATKTGILFIKFLVGSSEQSTVERAAKLLKATDEPKVNQAIVELIPNMLQEPRILQHIFKMDLVIPNNLDFSVLLAKQLLAVMPGMQHTDTLKGACDFSLKMLLKLKQHPVILMQYTGRRNVDLLLKIAQSGDEELAIVGIQLMRVILHLQSEQNINSYGTKNVDLSKVFQGSEARLKNALQLILFTASARNAYPIIKLATPSLGLYQTLLSIRNTTCSKQVYKALMKIMRLQPCLAASVHNAFCITIDSRKREIVHLWYLSFLMNWLSLMKNEKFYPLPVADIKTILSRADERYKAQVLHITALLNKCQPLPYSSTRLYFS